MAVLHILEPLLMSFQRELLMQFLQYREGKRVYVGRCDIASSILDLRFSLDFTTVRNVFRYKLHPGVPGILERYSVTFKTLSI
jgi:hypothetical protein